MTTPRISVRHVSTDLDIALLDEPSWEPADSAVINRYWNGADAPAGRRTEARLLWSNSALYVRFDAEQTETLFINEQPQTSSKTMKLWERDVCELFLASDTRNRRRYVEFEVAPTGEWLDLIVDWMKDEPRDWEYESGMETSALIAPGKVTMAMKIPWDAFGRRPKPGDAWLGNLFRQVGSGETRGYLAWSPTLTPEPQFHLPESFGEFLFR